MTAHCRTHIFKRARHFILTWDTDNLTKSKTEQKWVQGLTVVHIYLNGVLLLASQGDVLGG